ncbi:hypothetical protein [Kaistella sp.]|uniref:hypothetical protein n=1 Tax=Kaistella sp. TaxID=2782235 RepID=UPI0035A01099
MKKQTEIQLDFEIDKLTKSIENAISGESFLTEITEITSTEKGIIKNADWVFDWKSEIGEKTKSVFKLNTVENPKIIQGLISLTDKGDHIFMDLIESAKFNKGKNKLYNGVAGNLVAFACKVSFEKSYDGIVSFIAKTQLISHYEQTLGAKRFAGNRMFIDTKEAKILVKQYYKDFKL